MFLAIKPRAYRRCRKSCGPRSGSSLSLSLSSCGRITSLDRATRDWPPLSARFTTILNKGFVCHGAPLSPSLFALSARGRFALRKLRPLTRTLYLSLYLPLSLSLTLPCPSLLPRPTCAPLYLSASRSDSAFRARWYPLRAFSAFHRTTTQLSWASLTRLLQILRGSEPDSNTARSSDDREERIVCFSMRRVTARF